MKIRCWTFNTYLLCAALAVGLPGLMVSRAAAKGAESSTPAAASSSTNSAPAKAEKKKKKRKKEVVTVRVHLEVNRDKSDRIREITLLRGNPITVVVDKIPVVDESNIAEAKLVETPGGVELELQFESVGRTALENFSAANRGKRFVIYCDFGDQHRWLAAPVITRLISNGTLRFTPDADRDEVERIVEGLNRLAEVKKKKKKEDEPF